MTFRVLSALLTLAGAAAFGSAFPRAQVRAAEVACPNAMTQLAIDTCVGGAAAKAHAAEKAAYLALQIRARGTPKAATLAAREGSWLVARERNCRAQARAYAGGSIVGSIVAGCREASDRKRAAVLRAQLSAAR